MPNYKATIRKTDLSVAEVNFKGVTKEEAKRMAKAVQEHQAYAHLETEYEIKIKKDE